MDTNILYQHHYEFVCLVRDMLEAQELYFARKQKDKQAYLSYKRKKDMVANYVGEYLKNKRLFYCKTNMDTDGGKKCEFQCEECKIIAKKTS
jgi:hypothetical protein